MSRYISTKNLSSNGQTVSELWPFKVSPKVGECRKLEFGPNFDKPVLNEKIWIPRIHIVAAVQKILIPKQFLAVFCTFNVKKGFFSVNEKCCKTEIMAETRFLTIERCILKCSLRGYLCFFISLSPFCPLLHIISPKKVIFWLKLTLN